MAGELTTGETMLPEDEVEDLWRGRGSDGAWGPAGNGGAASWRLSLLVN